jgi:hypothetical protein
MSSPLRRQTSEWTTSNEGWSRVKHSVSDETPREFCGSRITLWYQRTLSFTARSWMRLIAQDTPSTPEPPNVSRLEEEFLVDENEEENHEICVRVQHVSKGHDRSFEASWKSATIEHSGVEMGKHLHGLHRGFASHLTWYTSIWVIVDRLTKSAHFIPVSTAYRV